MTQGLHSQKAAVDSGQWPLFRYNPERADAGENPFTLDSKAPRMPVKDYMLMETGSKCSPRSTRTREKTLRRSPGRCAATLELLRTPRRQKTFGAAAATVGGSTESKSTEQ